MVPFRERALAIFGDEKYFDGQVSQDWLYGAIPLAALGAMAPAGPLASTVCPDARKRPVLVLENEHTYDSCVAWNTESRQFSAVAFGGGNAVNGRTRALVELVRQCDASIICYFGDLDPNGLTIALSLSTEINRTSSLAVVPWLFAYEWLLNRGIRKDLFVQGKKQYEDTAWLGPLAVCADAFRGWPVGSPGELEYGGL